jgi:heme exporter protein D
VLTHAVDQTRRSCRYDEGRGSTPESTPVAPPTAGARRGRGRRVDDVPVNVIPGLVSGAGVPTAAIASLVNLAVAVLFFALLISIARSLRRIRRSLVQLEGRLPRGTRQDAERDAGTGS